MRFRASEQQWDQVRRLTDSSFVRGIDGPLEMGCVILFAENDHPARPSLLASYVLAPGQGDLLHQTAGALTLSSQYLRRALLAVRESGLKGFLTVHTHPLSDEAVSFSPYDDANDPELMSNLYDLQPTGLFGSIVLGRHSACARVWVDGEPRYLRDLVVTGEQISFVNLSGAPTKLPPAAALFDRSTAMTGRGALYRFSQLRVAVVGASGTGSLMIELLVRAGVSEVVVFEFDGSDETNLNRVVHLRMKDAQANVNKGKRLAEAMAGTGLPTRVTIVEGGDIRDFDVADALRGCDLLVGCVDRDWPRLILSEVAYQYLIPYADLGTEIGAPGDEIQSVDARVSYVGPGRPCLVCSGVIDEERVRLEGLKRGERDRVHAMGYSEDLNLKEPAVMDVNMRAASAAMLIIRHLFQPFLDTPLPHTLRESITNFASKRLRFESSPDCTICGLPLRIGSGGGFALTTRPDLSTPGHDSSVLEAA